MYNRPIPETLQYVVYLDELKQIETQRNSLLTVTKKRQVPVYHL